MRRTVVLLASVVIGILVCGAAWAETFSVRNTNDSGPGSLRAAITNANQSTGKDLITFAPNVRGEIRLKSRLPQLRSDLEIRGPGASRLTVRRAFAERSSVFTVNGTTVSISGLAISNGYAEIRFANEGGGGVRNQGGTLTLRKVAVSGNTAGAFGGGVANLMGGTLTVRDSTFSGNRAEGVEFPGGSSGGSGGAIFSFGGTTTVVGSTFSGNTAHRTGGAISAQGELTVRDSTFSENTAEWSGGAILVGRRATVRVEGSTFWQNTAEAFEGGGIFAYVGDLTVVNSTFAQNTALTGGGIHSDAFDREKPGRFPGITTVVASTFTGNEARQRGGGLYNRRTPSDAPNFFLRMNIVAGNEALEGPDAYGPARGPFTSRGYNLVGNPSGATGLGGPTDITDTSPRLDPEGLQDNGGPTKTIALTQDSPALDAVGEGCPPPATDQRGVSRPQNGDGEGEAKCDMGAYERGAPSSSP